MPTGLLLAVDYYSPTAAHSGSGFPHVLRRQETKLYGHWIFEALKAFTSRAPIQSWVFATIRQRLVQLKYTIPRKNIHTQPTSTRSVNRQTHAR